MNADGDGGRGDGNGREESNGVGLAELLSYNDLFATSETPQSPFFVVIRRTSCVLHQPSMLHVFLLARFRQAVLHYYGIAQRAEVGCIVVIFALSLRPPTLFSLST